jgi:hypothetical protein
VPAGAAAPSHGRIQRAADQPAAREEAEPTVTAHSNADQRLRQPASGQRLVAVLAFGLTADSNADQRPCQPGAVSCKSRLAYSGPTLRATRKTRKDASNRRRNRSAGRHKRTGRTLRLRAPSGPGPDVPEARNPRLGPGSDSGVCLVSESAWPGQRAAVRVVWRAGVPAPAAAAARPGCNSGLSSFCASDADISVARDSEYQRGEVTSKPPPRKRPHRRRTDSLDAARAAGPESGQWRRLRRDRDSESTRVTRARSRGSADSAVGGRRAGRSLRHQNLRSPSLHSE